MSQLIPLFQVTFPLTSRDFRGPEPACHKQAGWSCQSFLPSDNHLSCLGASLALHSGSFPRQLGLRCGNATSLPPWAADIISPSLGSRAGEAMAFCYLSPDSPSLIACHSDHHQPLISSFISVSDKLHHTPHHPACPPSAPS